MLNKTKRLLAIMLAVALVFSLVGCSKAQDDGSSVIVQEEIVYEYQDGETSGGNGTTSGGTTQQGGTTNKKPGSTTSGTTPTGGVNPADYKGTTIQFASTIDPKDDGTDYVVKNFEKKYGITVKIVACTLENYGNEMAGLIAAGKAPTVGRSNGDFPAFLGYFQSLDAAKIDYTDPIWNQTTFKKTTYNGAPYLCDTVGNFWTERDLVVYSKNILKRAGCPTPEELDKAGNWNFDTYLEIGKKVKEANIGVDGVTFGNYDVVLNIGGGSTFKLDSTNHVTNGIDAQTTSIFQKYATAKDAGYVNNKGIPGFMQGMSAMCTEHLWVLRTDGSLAKYSNRNDLGFYYLPAAEKGGKSVVTGIFRGWGIMKGCNENPATGPKSAVAGGLFLKEYLDVNNYNLDTSFISEDAKTFFFKVTSQYAEAGDSYNPYLTYNNLNTGITGLNYNADIYTAMHQAPSQVPSLMAAVKSKAQNGTDKINKFIDNALSSR